MKMTMYVTEGARQERLPPSSPMRMCTPLTKSEEKEWLFAVYSLGNKFKNFPEFKGTKRRLILLG